MTIPTERLDQIAHRFAELEARMASGTLEQPASIVSARTQAAVCAAQPSFGATVSV